MISRFMGCRAAPYALAVALLTTQSACYDWVAVNPVDASKLGGSFETPIGQNVVAVRVVDVRQPDGRLVELQGSYKIRVTLQDGNVHELKPPLGVEENGDRLVFRSGNEAPLDVARTDVVKLEAYHYNKGATVAAIVVVTVVAAIAVAVVTVVAVSQESSDLNASY
jgi:hypothetical protein